MVEGTVEIAGTVRVDRASETHNLIALAVAALDNSNPSEAYDYANRVLEIDTDDANAWTVKGKAAGWSSTMNNFRVAEMLVPSERAEELTPPDDRENFRHECADVMNGVAVAVHNLSWNHAQQFPGVDGVWTGHIGRCKEIVAVLQAAYEWGRERQPLDNIIVIVSNLIRGIKFKVASETRTAFLVPAYQQQMQQLLEQTATEIRKFDPEYETPHPKKVSALCFIVTATMGNDGVPCRHAPVVQGPGSCPALCRPALHPVVRAQRPCARGRRFAVTANAVAVVCLHSHTRDRGRMGGHGARPQAQSYRPSAFALAAS